MLRVDDTSSPAIERLQDVLDHGLDWMARWRVLSAWLMPQPRVTGIGVSITPLLPGNPELAGELYRNRFALAGSDASGGTGSIFALPPPSEAWSRELHSFSWLPHLAAGGLEMHRAFARTIIGEWIGRRRGHPRLARQTLVRAHRLKTMVQCAPFLLSGATESFREQFFRMLARDTMALSVTSPRSDARLPVAIALAHATTSLEGLEGLRPGAFERLELELGSQVLADGGHASRNPSRLLALLVDLLPLRAALAASHQILPRGFNSAIERMLPMLRFFSHGDEGLAAFQGVPATMTRELRAILGHDSTLGRPLSHAPHSGYARLAQGSALVIADIGNNATCASPLAFEFSDGVNRIVVNCGLPAGGSGKWRAAACQEAAHSTATFLNDGANAGARGLLDRWFRRKEELPNPRCTGRVAQSEHGPLLRSQNHAFAGRPRLVHERDIYLSANGNDLRGQDRFLAAQNASFDDIIAIRFHLHPQVKATQSQDGASIMLSVAGRSGWKFSLRGGALSLEESVYLLGSATARATQQIVVRLDGGEGAQINWAFKRIERRSSKSKPEAESPELPL